MFNATVASVPRTLKLPPAMIFAYPFAGFRFIVTVALRISRYDGTMTRFAMEPVISMYGPSVVFAPALPLTETLVEPMVIPPANET